MKKNDIYLQLLVHCKIHQHSTVYLTSSNSQHKLGELHYCCLFSRWMVG